jgi:ATP-dependent DNA ligase
MLPFGIEPMLAKAVEALPQPDALPGGCAYEPKFDGYRALLYVTADGCQVQSRGRHDITDAFDDVATAAAANLPEGVVLDGELVVWDGAALNFSALGKRLASRSKRPRSTLPASFVAFDLLAAAGHDLRSQPLKVRRQALEALLDQATPPLQLAPQTTDVTVAQTWRDEYTASPVGIEGLVIKGLSTRYEPGKRGWSKLRVRDTTDVIVGAVTGTIDHPRRLIIALPLPDGELRPAGSTLELNTSQRRTMSGLLRPAEPNHPWPADMTSSANWGGTAEPLTLVTPEVVIEVSADTSFENGRWRHPLRFIRPRAASGHLPD